MKLPLSWLKDFVEINLSLDEIAEALTMGGLEVDKIEEKNGDVLFEISLTPNLGHCMSVLGIARELSALKDLPLKEPSLSVKEDPKQSLQEMVSVEIKDAEQCNRYACRLVTNVKVGPSPAWMVKRLEASGIRSINNVVDVTNYVMLERGQPLHAFDYDKLSGKKIFITSKSSSSELVTLDEKSYKIPEGVLLIADEKKPLAFAGVMGGMDSSVSESTQTILLESAYFTPQAVRKSCKQLGLRTESSQRFEKEVDFAGVPAALDRAASLLQEIAHGNVAKGMIDVAAGKREQAPITCRMARITEMLGIHLSLREVVTIFKKLQIKILRENQDSIEVLPPSFRNDLKIEIDLIEEVARIYGYKNIPPKRPKHVTSPLDSSPLFIFEREMRERLVAQGLQECMSCDLISPSLAQLTAEIADQNAQISVLHPASVDQSVLRTSLLPGLLQMTKLNLAHQTREISAFEIGRIHFKDKGHYKEQTMIGILCSGPSAPHHFNPKPQEFDFYDLKGKIESLLLGLGIENVIFEQSHLHNFHPGRQARIRVGDLTIGALGEIHPVRLAALDIEPRVYFAELNLHELLHLKRKEWKVQNLSLFPGSERDWTMTVKEEASIGHLLKLINEISSPYLEKVQLLGIYRDARLGKEKKNVSFRFYYRDKEKTLSFEAVEGEHTKISQEVAKKLELLLD
ncbi:MAG: phenylalanine--tRNA ligase subunit beta [Chlamydiales bacterium]|nr:phenylalanine--tRNA ligase subunit beta [Chlamydiales bacterium]